MNKIRRFFKIVFSVSRQNLLVKMIALQILSEIISIAMFMFLTISAAIVFVGAVIHYFNHTAEHPLYPLIKEVLTAVELMFIAPIPFLLVHSFKSKIIDAYSDQVDPEVLLRYELRYSLFSETSAKKGFFGALIGVVSTFSLSSLIELSEWTSLTKSIFHKEGDLIIYSLLPAIFSALIIVLGIVIILVLVRVLRVYYEFDKKH